MPLPAALAARLAKRGLITGSEKHGMSNYSIVLLDDIIGTFSALCYRF